MSTPAPRHSATANKVELEMDRAAIRTRGLLLAGAAVLLALPAVLSPTVAVAQPIATGAEVDELIVTARKREERLQDIPAAGSAVTGERIEEAGGITEQRGLTALLPGVSLVDNDSGNSEFAIRGAGQAGRSINADAAIALLRNGAQVTGGNIGGRGFARMDFFDIGQIEVLRGAQGSLYGANAVGGVISIVSQDPKPDFETILQGTWNFTRQGADALAIVNIPINEQLAFRGGVDLSEQRGRVHNTFRDDYIDGTSYRAARASLGFTPEARFRAVLSIDVSRIDDVAGAQVDVQRRRYDAIPETWDYLSETEANTKANFRQNIFNGGLKMEADLGFAELTSTTNYRWRDSFVIADDDGRYPNAPVLASTGARNIAGGTACRNNTCFTRYADQASVFYHELRLDGDLSALNWQLGADFRSLDDRYSISNFGRVTASGAAQAPSFQVLISDNRTFGAFATGAYAVTSQLTVEGSLRWTQDEKVFFGGLSTGTPQLGSIPFRTKTYVNWTYGGSISWRPTDKLNIYARAATGFRAGGFNRDFGTSSTLPGNPATPIAYGVENSTAYEAGIKYVHSRALRVSAVAFYTDYRDVLIVDQGVRFPAQGGGTFNYLNNLGNADAMGVDLELNGNVPIWPARDGRLSYTLAGVWVDSELASPIATLNGSRLNGTPEFTLTANGTYYQPVGGGLTGFLNLTFQGETGGFYNILNTVDRDTNRNLQLRAGVRSAAGWEAALRVTNVLDQRYVFLYGAGFRAETPGTEYMIQLRYRL